MLIQIEEKQTVTKSIELKLPAFYRDPHVSSFTMIGDNETIITINLYESYKSVIVVTKDCDTHNKKVAEAIEGVSIDWKEFYAAWDIMIEHLETEVLKPIP